jgi:hypothetical protein
MEPFIFIAVDAITTNFTFEFMNFKLTNKIKRVSKTTIVMAISTSIILTIMQLAITDTTVTLQPFSSVAVGWNTFVAVSFNSALIIA